MAVEYGPNAYVVGEDGAPECSPAIPRTSGGESILDFGYRASAPEDYGQALAEHDPNEPVPIAFNDPLVDLTAPAKAAYGKPIPYNWQLTGSCVNGGGFNALVNRIGVEIATGRQAEAFELPFTLMTYGLSRWLAFRDNTEGEGSAGAAFVSAAKEGGLPPFSDPDVPKPAILVSMDGKHAVHAFSRRDEFYWSSVRNHTAGIKERAKKVTIQYVRIRSADQGEVEIRRGRTITWAGMWGGLMRVPVEGGRKDSKVLLNRHASSWSHQQSCSMMWHHRDLGRIWNIQNQWFGPGPNTKVETVAVSGGRAVSRILEAVDVMSVHGDPVDPYSPLGSYWISDADFEYQCARGEVFATYLIGGYSGLVGVGSV